MDVFFHNFLLFDGPNNKKTSLIIKIKPVSWKQTKHRMPHLMQINHKQLNLEIKNEVEFESQIANQTVNSELEPGRCSLGLDIRNLFCRNALAKTESSKRWPSPTEAKLSSDDPSMCRLIGRLMLNANH